MIQATAPNRGMALFLSDFDGRTESQALPFRAEPEFRQPLRLGLVGNNRLPQCRCTQGLRPVLLALLCLMAASSQTGCAFRGMMSARFRDPLAGAPRLRNVSNPQMDEIVAHINRNSTALQGWRANSVRIEANRWMLSGNLAVEKGNHIRLVVTSAMGKEVDLGSNEDRFWVWSRRMDPPFVTCRHENIETARQQLGIPFEPQWLMQALGVESLSTDGLKMELDPSRRQVRLVQEVMTAQGQPLRRAVLFDLKSGTVIEHSLYNYDGVRVALARLSGHKVENSDGVVLPHRILLDWPQIQMSMTMDLGRIQVNPQSVSSEIWAMPDSPGSPLVHLDAGAPPTRIVIQPDAAARRDLIESEGPLEEVNQDSKEGDDLTPERQFERPRDYSGRARLLDLEDDSAPAKCLDDDWTK